MGDVLVTVATYVYHPDAAVAQALLESHGMKVFLADVESSYSSHEPGVFGRGVKLQVPSSQVEWAQQVLDEVASAAAANKPSTDDSDDASSCPSCGVVMAEDEVRCSACGWTYDGGEEWKLYENGPVPASLLPLAFSSTLSRRFGLPYKIASLYLRWCQAEGLIIRGWETWRWAQPRHVVLSCRESGDLEDARAEVEKSDAATDNGLLISFNVFQVEDDA